MPRRCWHSEAVLDPLPTALAPIGRRLGARLLDGLVLLPVTFVLIGLFADVRLDDAILDVPGWVRWALWLVVVGYEVVLIALSGQTIGKRWMGIRVVDAVTGAVPNLDQSVRRALPSMLGAVPIIGGVAFLLYLPALWDPRRQGLHDRLAATIVVNA